jgi:hypothetical protein
MAALGHQVYFSGLEVGAIDGTFFCAGEDAYDAAE